jgi:hypothetical protein
MRRSRRVLMGKRAFVVSGLGREGDEEAKKSCCGDRRIFHKSGFLAVLEQSREI